MTASGMVTRFLTIAGNKSVFAAAEQVLLSAANFLIAVFILKKLGVTLFGVYSLFAVIIMLSHGIIASVINGQMVLRIANARNRVQQSLFRQSVQLFLSIYLIAVLVLILGFLILGKMNVVPSYGALPFVASLSFGAFSLFDLFRRYLFLLGQQRLSFGYTSIYVVCLLLGLIYLWFEPGESTDGVASVFVVNIIALFVSIAFNKNCLRAIRQGRKHKTLVKVKILRAYFKQGRYGLLGTVVAWLQNQSITPILMYFAGATVVGYFNIARLIMMPIVVINVGLIASTTPQFRRCVKTDNIDKLWQSIRQFSLGNLVLCLCYFSALFLFHVLGIMEKIVPEYHSTLPFLLVWSPVVALITYRSWVSQYFIVRMKFEFLLYTAITAVFITLTFMVAGFLATQSYYVVAGSVILGELYLVIAYKVNTLKADC